ncbi:hypothetical protein ACFYRJ_17540 [Streptomyces sp. NPDC005531]|uniref:hypothetical protein n=1 Tax=Streptomyces sp. NPDC005531 TaxID=3364722 RepID=UPI00369FBD8C
MTDTRTETAASLLHLVDRAERGSLLAEEAQQLRAGIRALKGRDQEMEQLRADLDRVQQSACNTAEALRLNALRLDSVLADRENERAARAAEEKRARVAEAAIGRVRQMVDAWEQRLPDAIRTATAVEALRTAIDRVQQPTA